MLLSQQHVACHSKHKKAPREKECLRHLVADDSSGRRGLYYVSGISEILLFVRRIFRKNFLAKNFSALSARNSRRSDRRKTVRRAEHWLQSG